MTTSAGTAGSEPLEIQRSIPGSNHARLLKLLYRRGNRSRADLARAAGFTKATVSSLIAEMLEAGLVVETRQRPVDGPGRPSVDLDLARTSWVVLAVDLSPDDEFAAALIDLGGAIRDRASVTLGGARGEDAFVMARELIDTLLARAEVPVLGIGVCVPGIVDLEGVVLASLNRGWVGLTLGARLSEHTGLPVCVANDANAAALAEREVTQGREDLMLVKVGSGVGAAIIANGQLLHGHRFSAGEIAHITTAPGGPRCVCGRFGCLEATLSAPRLAALLRASDGSPDRRAEVLENAGHQLGGVLAPLVGALALTTVVVSGLPPSYADDLLAATRASLSGRIPPDLSAPLTLRGSDLGEDVMIRGAVILVLSGVLGII
jgi:predicted NBD/HSP70 family sugar kinase